MKEQHPRQDEILREAENWLMQANTKPRHILETSDGRQIEFYSSFIKESSVPEYAFSALKNRIHNTHSIYMHLRKRGVVVLPEVEAKDSNDEPIETQYAVYVDSRIGRSKLFRLVNMVGWSNEQDLSQARLNQEVVPTHEVAAALDRGIEETGIGAILEQMRAEDAVPGLDRSHIISTIHDHLD